MTSTIRGDIAPGTILRGERKKISAERLLTFSGGPLVESGWPRRNIHTDTDFARSTGLPSRCASGTQFQGQMAEFLISAFGDGWFRHGEMAVKFVDLVLEDQMVTACAKVVGSEPVDGKGARVNLEIWSECEDGRKVMTGTATGLVN